MIVLMEDKTTMPLLCNLLNVYCLLNMPSIYEFFSLIENLFLNFVLIESTNLISVLQLVMYRYQHFA